MWAATCHWLLVLWIYHHLQGSQTSSQPWYNLSRQDIQPLCHDAILTPELEEAHNKRNDSGNIFFSARINKNVAYHGSCCLEIEGETQMLEILHSYWDRTPLQKTVFVKFCIEQAILSLIWEFEKAGMYMLSFWRRQIANIGMQFQWA